MTYLIKIGREAMDEKLIAYGNKNFSLSASVDFVRTSLDYYKEYE